RARLRPQVGQLVAGGEDGDPRAAEHAHLRIAERRQEPDLGGADRAARPPRIGPPGGTTTSPARTSSPAGRTYAPDETLAAMVIRPLSAATSSCGTTASAPSGSGPPVKIRIASPARSARDGIDPAMIRA